MTAARRSSCSRRKVWQPRVERQLIRPDWVADWSALDVSAAGLVAQVGRSRCFSNERFDVVHVFRIATIPFARHWLDPPGPPPRRHLDLDEVESTTQRRLAAVRRQNGEDSAAERDENAAERVAALEAAALARFDRIYICSELDRERLQGVGSADFRVLPNALPAPEALTPAEANLPFTFLFVGTLGFYPNEDAVLYFCREMLPRIRSQARRTIQLAIVGPGAPPSIRALEALPEVRVVGPVAELALWYQNASAIVVPLRAGGGTRIKVLEAFAYRRPVVSTSIGVEGIAARDGEHALIADTPDGFAYHCLRLMDDPALASALTERAFGLFRRCYSTEALARIVAALP